MKSGSRDFPLGCKNVLFSSVARKRAKNQPLVKTVFLLCFLQPRWAVGRVGLGKKYTKSGDAILVIQHPPDRVTAPWVGKVGLPPSEMGGKKTWRKKLDASDTAQAQSEGVQCSHIKVL